TQERIGCRPDFHRYPQHLLLLDYHRRIIHRFTEPHPSSLTPHLLHRDRQTSQARLNMERINRDRDLIRQSSKQGPRRGFAQTSTFPPDSFHRPPTRAHPTNPNQLNLTSERTNKRKKLNPKMEPGDQKPATMELNDAEQGDLTDLPPRRESRGRRVAENRSQNPNPDPCACRRESPDRNNHTKT
ncbi:hypothetical protein IGI04_034133, partial [Brassica rapa subsp. trilocularis]